MTLHLTSDGTPHGTALTTAAGEPIRNIRTLTLHLDAANPLCSGLTLDFALWQPEQLAVAATIAYSEADRQQNLALIAAMRRRLDDVERQLRGIDAQEPA